MSYLGRKANHYLRKVQNGDVQAFKDLYKLTVLKLKRVAALYLTNKSEVDDVIQETFCRVYLYSASAKPEQDCYNWLCKIVQRVAYDFNKINHESLENLPTPPADAQTFYILDRWMDKSEICKAAATLEPLNQSIVYLYYFETLSLSQVATVLGLPKSTVSDRLQKCQREIKKFLIK